MKYSKLVRDKIPDRIRNKGEECKTHIATDEEYGQKLNEKLLEEVNEFLKDESAEELADILEVLDAIREHKGFSWFEVKSIKNKKVAEKGRFRKRIILDEA